MSNDFLIFAGDPSANVMSQSAYSSLASRTAGFSSGIAQSIQLNKVWRQSSLMSSMIGQFISDNSGNNATDDGTIAALESNFILAIQNVNFKVVHATLNLYVNSATGNDSNTGLAPTIPFKTIPGALKAAFSGYNFNGFPLSINLFPGTYTQPVKIQGLPLGCTSINIIGNSANPSSTQINVVNDIAFTITFSALVNITGVTVTATGSATQTSAIGAGVLVGSGASVSMVSCVVGSCGTQQLSTDNAGLINLVNITFTGSSQYCMTSGSAGIIFISNTSLTWTNAVYSVVNAQCTLGGIIQAGGVTVSGTATGQRYNSQSNGIIFVSGAGISFFPGTVAGTTGTGGIYF